MPRRWFIAVLVACGSLATFAVAGNKAVSIADAAESNDTARVLALLKEGADPNAAQVDGMTALHWAAYHDNVDLALALLDARADPTTTNRYEIAPLTLACRNGNTTMVERLLQAGADANTKTPGGETVLMSAARTGVVGPVRALVQAGANIDATLPNGQTALMWASAENYIGVVRVLLDAGADFTTPLKESGYTPFFFAVRGGYRDMVKLFLDRGADLHADMQPGQKGGTMPRKGTTALVLAVENGHFELALDLLERGADPNDSNVGQTPLHLLVRVRKPDRGEGAGGEPPPPVLGDVDSIDFARELVARGANVNARIENGDIKTDGSLTMRGATPFLLACDTADLTYMKFLVGMGADPVIPNADGTTPLMAAAGIGSMAPEEEAGTPEECLLAVQFLVSLGAGVNDVNGHGETAMHGAAYKNAPELVRYLHEQGADIGIWNNKNELGWTPLYIAEGYRPGNFKPSFETIDAVAEVMLANGVAYPDEPRPVHVNYSP